MSAGRREVARARLLPLALRLVRLRRPLAAALAAASVVVAVGAARPAAEPEVTVLTAARAVTGGAPLVAADLASATVPRSTVPVGALTPGQDLVGRVPVGPVNAGETFTDVRLLGPGLLAGLGGVGLVASAVRLDDPAATSLLRSGDRVDVLAARGDEALADPGAAVAGRPARVVAADVQVLVVPTDTAAPGEQGGLVVVATDTATAARLAASAVTDRLSVVVRGDR